MHAIRALYPVMHMAWDESVMVGALLSPSAASAKWCL